MSSAIRRTSQNITRDAFRDLVCAARRVQRQAQANVDRRSFALVGLVLFATLGVSIGLYWYYRESLRTATTPAEQEVVRRNKDMVVFSAVGLFLALLLGFFVIKYLHWRAYSKSLGVAIDQLAPCR